MKRNKFVAFSVALFIGAAAFGEFQNNSGSYYDSELASGSDININIDSINDTEAIQVIAGGVFVDLNSVASKVSNVNTPQAGFYGGSAWGKIAGDVRSEISNSTFSYAVGGSIAAIDVPDKSGNIGGSTYLTFNSGTISTDIAGGSDLRYQHQGDIGGSTNLTINGGTIGGNVIAGGLLTSGDTNKHSLTSANLTINASDSANKISIGGKIFGLSNAGKEQAESVNILFTGNGENLNFTGTVSSIESSSYSESMTWYASAKERVISFGDATNAFTGKFNGTIENGKIDGTNQFNELSIGKSSSVEFTQEFDLDIDTLSIFSDAEVLGNATINVEDTLNIFISNAFSETELVLDLGESIVLSSEAQNNVSIFHEDGSVFEGAEFAYDAETNSFAISNVPEPSTYAAIFGALALAFAAYRRRK